MCANSENSGETARMRRLAWALAGHLCDKYRNLMSWLKYLFYSASQNDEVFVLLCMFYSLGFNMTSEMLKTTDGTILAYHRITEAFKFAYAKRTSLGDPKFIDIEKVCYKVKVFTS